MSIDHDVALHVMSWTKYEYPPTSYVWCRSGRPSIRFDQWRPSQNVEQAFEALHVITKGEGFTLYCNSNGVAPIYRITARCKTASGLSLPAVLCDLALQIANPQ